MEDVDYVDSVERGYKRLSSLFGAPQAQSLKCQRCGHTVYQQERIGPVNDVIFHKQCFRCCTCGGYVTLKNYWTNQTSVEDKEIYCQTHAPRVGGSRLDNSAMGIQRALSAQDNLRRAHSKMTELRFQGEQPGPAIDHESLSIKAALTQSRQQQQTRPTGEQMSAGHKFTIDENAVHIRGAIDAQLLQRRNERRLEKHHYPPHIVKKREQLFETQKRLEEQLRHEEDEMFREFCEEREKEENAINNEIDSEWERQLEKLTQKYQQDMSRKKMKPQDSHSQMMTEFENEKKDLAATMTSKKQNKKKTMTLRLRQKEQEQTAELVKKQSQVMLEMLAKEQEELKAELAMEKVKTPASTDRVNDGQGDLDEVLEVLSLPCVAAPPSPKAPLSRKADLLPDLSILNSIDEQVIKVAENEQLTYTDLVRQLTEGLLTDLEKARAIYRWICVKDLNVIEFADDLKADTPMGLLRGIKFGTETYHVLFMRLCSYAGLHCVEVKGHSKSVGYEPGMRMTPGTFQNTWNSVFIAGEWRLIQCNWGARHLVFSKDKEERSHGSDHIRYQYDDHYFMTDPDEFILEFWPQDPKWQLLDSPISLEQFEALPFVRSIFFHYNMRFEGHRQAVVSTDSKGGVKFTIRVPEEHENDLVFFYQLRFADKERSKDQTYRGHLLERYVFETMVDNAVTFSVHVPTAGQYFMEIFANKINKNGRVENNNANVAPFKLKCACKFKIICESLSGTMHPLPNCAPGEWGPKKAQRHFGIVPVTSPTSECEMEKAGMLAVEDKVELKFQTPQPYQFVAKLRMNHVESKVLDPYVNLSSEGTVLTVCVSLPQPGQYGLDIFARPKGSESATLSHACKYLINCTKVLHRTDLPKYLPTAENHRSKYGPTPGFDELGLQIISQEKAKIILDKTNTTSVAVKIPADVVLSYQFLREPDEDNRDYVNQICQPNGIVQFTVSVPKKGNYMLSLYARKENSNHKSAPNVYNYFIQYLPDSGHSSSDGRSI